MYYPYFRGKQFELIAIREMAELLAAKNFVPIIEPVRESLGGLKKALETVNYAHGKAIVIVNPCYGDHQENGTQISSLLAGEFKSNRNIAAGILLRHDMTVDDVMTYYNRHINHAPVLIHSGFTSPQDLAARLSTLGITDLTHIFIEEQTSLLYRKKFAGENRILVRDGFKRQRNADYPELEEFSDLHITYTDFKMDGFGDFLVVGDAYSESGGPAYAVAIHITFIDPNNDDVMYIYHFVSDSKDTPTDPAGKFAQALAKLIAKVDSPSSCIRETKAIQEFRKLHTDGHFPGLGYVKKLSMKHHIETLAAYLS